MGSPLPRSAPIVHPAKALVFAVAALLVLLLPAQAVADSALDGVAAAAAETAVPAAAAAASAAEPAVEAAAPAVETVVQAVEPAVVEAAPVLAEAAGTGAPIVETAVQATQPVKQAITPAAEPVVAQVQPVVAAAAEVVEPVLAAAAQVAEPVLETAAPLIEPIADTVSPLTSPLFPPGMGFAPPVDLMPAMADSSAIPGLAGPVGATSAAAQGGTLLADGTALPVSDALDASLLALRTEPALIGPVVTPPEPSTELGATFVADQTAGSLAVRLPFGLSPPGSLAAASSTTTLLMLVLAASAALALPTLGRRVRLRPEALRPPAFISLLERPG